MNKKLSLFFSFILFIYIVDAQSTYKYNRKLIDSLKHEYDSFNCYEVIENNIPNSQIDVDIKLIKILNKAPYINTFSEVVEFAEKNKFNDFYTSNPVEIDSILNEIIYSKQTVDSVFGNIKIFLYVTYNRFTNKLGSCAIKFSTKSRFGCYFLYEGKRNYIDNFIDFRYVTEKLLKHIKWPLSLGQDKSTLDLRSHSGNRPQ